MYNRLLKLRDPSVEDNQLIAYDAPHETKRKIQLERLFNRTKEQVHHMIHTHVLYICIVVVMVSVLVLLIMLVHVISNIGLCLCVIVYYIGV